MRIRMRMVAEPCRSSMWDGSNPHGCFEVSFQCHGIFRCGAWRAHACMEDVVVASVTDADIFADRKRLDA